MTEGNQPLDEAALAGFGIAPGIIDELAAMNATLSLSLHTRSDSPVGICTVKNGGGLFPRDVEVVLERVFAEVIGSLNITDGFELSFRIK
jgi:hypothetical protein